MGEEYDAKVFRSGNSVALRLPKALGFKEGDVMRVREDRGSLVMQLVGKPKRKFDIEKVWGIGKHLDLQPIADVDRVFEHRSLLWEDAQWLSSLAKREP